MNRFFIFWLSGFFFSMVTMNAGYAQAPVVQDLSGYPTGNPSTGLAFGNGIYLSLTYPFGVYSSTNGETWSKANTSTIPNGMDKITFGKGLFVMTGAGGRIMTSTDGNTWTARTSGTINRMYDIAFIENKFFAVGQKSTVLTSSDGITWSSVSIGTTDEDLMNITYGNGTYVIGSRKSGTQIYYSTTAASNSWTKKSITNLLINKVQYLKNRFYLFTSSTNVFTSTNGITWTDATTTLILTLPNNSKINIGTPNQAFSGIYDGNKIILSGFSQFHNSYGSLFSSTDGTNFKLENRTSEVGSGQLVFCNNKYFQFGNSGIVFSNDGINFKYPGSSYFAMASNGNNHIGVGAVSSTGMVMKSNGFSTWTQANIPYNKGLYAVTYTGSKFVAGGENTLIQSTDNGNTWTIMMPPANYTFTALASDPSVIVAGGYSNISGSILYSVNGGLIWLSANNLNNYYFKIKRENGIFFALGYENLSNEGVIMYSLNGINWTRIVPSLTFPVCYYNDVVYDGKKYVFMGMSYNADYSALGSFFSVSTETPTIASSFTTIGQVTSPAGLKLGGDWGNGAFAYTNGYYLGAVNDMSGTSTQGQTNIIYSQDAINWTAIPLSSNSVIYGISVEGNMFNMIGSGNGNITASVASVLPVTLVNFNAAGVNGSALLTWQTAGETNSSHFTVQHSIDGNFWTQIGTVSARGQSTLQNYSLTHEQPLNGNNYYRLIQVDNDNKQKISAVKKLFIGQGGKFHTYPNPAKDWTTLDLPGTGPAQIKLFSAGGQQVKTLQVNNERSVKLSLKNLATGLYYIVVIQNGQKFSSDLYHE